MDTALLRRLLELFEASEFAELEYKAGDRRIRLVRSAQGSVPGLTQKFIEKAPVSAPAVSNIKSIVAPCVGTFFRSAEVDAPALVSVGDYVSEGQTLAIVEAMKMFNPIDADCHGILVKFHVENGASVEAGMPLCDIQLEIGPDV